MNRMIYESYNMIHGPYDMGHMLCACKELIESPYQRNVTLNA